MPLTLQRELLHRIKALNQAASLGVNEMLSSSALSALTREYEANLKKRYVDIGFNLFAIISDLYYRENFHSDILKAVLDPASKHREGAKYLHLFLNFLRLQGVKVTPSDYANSVVVREEGRIDILIKDDSTSKAVIIENKINGAPDMPRQLPRYLEIVTAEGYTCDAIIYLRLNGHAGPDMTGWSATDRQQVCALMTIIPAYAETENDLLNGWIIPSLEASCHQDVQHILCQYGELIKKLGSNIMNKPVMDNFYNLIIQGENFKTALSIRAMLDDLILYRVEKLITHFQYDLVPFDKVGNYQNYAACFMNLFWKDAHLGIDIVVAPETYEMAFWDRNPGEKGHAKTILQRMGCLDDFVLKNGRFAKLFTFPSQELDLIEYVTTFKKKLAAATVDS